jgi:hypothetical protein
MSVKEQYLVDLTKHSSEDELELYVHGKLTPDRVDAVEDHLLVCQSCRTALDEAVVYYRAMRAGLAHAQEFRPRGWFQWTGIPSFALAVAALVIVAAAGWFMTRTSAPRVPLAVIELVAMRGDMPVTDRAWETELRLKDLADFAGDVEVVDANGGPVWKGAVTSGGILRVNKTLAEGTYFVRAYQGSKLVHEYGFRVRPN